MIFLYCIISFKVWVWSLAVPIQTTPPVWTKSKVWPLFLMFPLLVPELAMRNSSNSSSRKVFIFYFEGDKTWKFWQGIPNFEVYVIIFVCKTKKSIIYFIFCQNHWKMTILISNLSRGKNWIKKFLISHMKNKIVLGSVLTKKYGIYNFLMELYAYENHHFLNIW